MFNPLRLLRRKDYIDDSAAAYIEGRATERDEAELRARAEREPGLYDELDSIRSTVSLLRSIEPVSAPRSFALAEAPVQVRVRRSRMAMAPAAFAIAAAAVVGLLAVGSLADVVRQNDGSSFGTSSGSSEDLRTATNAESEATGPQGPAGPAGGGGAADMSGVTVGESGDAARSAATSTPAAAQPTGTSIAEPMSGPAPDDSLMPPAAPEFSTESIDAGDTAAMVGPDIGDGASEQDAAASLPFDPNADMGASSSIAQSEPEQAEPGQGEPIVEGGPSEQLRSDEPMPLPEATVTGFFEQRESVQLDAVEPSTGAESPSDDPSGFALPLWQLQLAFASFAVLMAGAWMILQRRLTA